MPENEGEWLSKKEAALRLGVSVRTLERHAQGRRVVTAYVEGKYGAQLVFNADSIDALKAELAEMTPASDISVDRAQSLARVSTPPDDRMTKALDALIERLEQGLNALKPALPEGPKAAAQSVPIADKLTLDLVGASALTGLSRGYLLKAIHSKKLKASKRGKGWNLKRSDIDAWVKKL
jgi:excisionase family DNA binding protein